MHEKHPTTNYDFVIPDEKIALYPNKKRDHSKMLYIQNIDKTHKNYLFYHILDLLTTRDILVINDTRVQKSRFFLKNKKNRTFEVLIVQQQQDIHICKIQKSKRLKIGDILTLTPEIWAKIIDKDEQGLIYIQFNSSVTPQDLEQQGEYPLPPYILKKRKYDRLDEKSYQTVFSKVLGSRATPTAGLHFTKKLLSQIKNKGICIVPIQLFVSLGTFQPIQTDCIEEHPMHDEFYNIPEHTGNLLNIAIKNQQRIIAVGTTVLRTLESAFNPSTQTFNPGRGKTNLFIKPGYQIRSANALITNFHTPRSTLFVLICSILGETYAKKIYQYALENDYRFFSYGDAMLIDGLKID